MANVKFTKEHEWVRVEGEAGTVGITDHAQEQLGDLVYIELPEVGRAVAQGDEIAVVESVKAASEVYSPLSGEVIEVNQAIADDPARVNSDPMGAWFYKIKLSNPAEMDALLDQAAYNALVAGNA